MTALHITRCCSVVQGTHQHAHLSLLSLLSQSLSLLSLLELLSLLLLLLS
jgi:hypothetical protein